MCQWRMISTDRSGAQIHYTVACCSVFGFYLGPMHIWCEREAHIVCLIGSHRKNAVFLSVIREIVCVLL